MAGHWNAADWNAKALLKRDRQRWYLSNTYAGVSLLTSL
ncbi:hypothetical protein RCH17_002980 [Arthrobacter sp. MP_M7]|nr:hypothetical protein [Arthrobacter sp. MP_M4]MEC5204161.1 hypothetical protein [Arthrobacter sp. MP_M7]